MTTKTEYVRARIAHDIKEAAEEILSKLGLGHTEAIRMFYQQVILNKGIPFDVKIPNRETRKAMQDVRDRKNLRRAIDVEDLKNQIFGK